MDQFVGEKGLTVCTCYAENESGARLDRPALFRLMAESRPGDILLVKDVDRLSRLVSADWEKLKCLIGPPVRFVQNRPPRSNSIQATPFGSALTPVSAQLGTHRIS